MIYVDKPFQEFDEDSLRLLSPDEIIDDIRLSMIEGIGSLTTQRLLERFGTAAAVFAASASELTSVDGIRSNVVPKILGAKDELCADGLIELCKQESIQIISIRDTRYPALLRQIYDPPQILYIKGEIKPQDAFSIAVVGTRRMTAYGRRMTEKLVAPLAKAGFTIISGLADGIDGVAHQTALKEAGRTLAVLGSGISHIYPYGHKTLADEIVRSQQGAIISEFHPLMQPNKGTFPQRNRIVSGMSLGVLVVEAPEKSGAMITARLAGEHGREIFAVAGQADSFTSQGCNLLIQDGATITSSADDIFREIGPIVKNIIRLVR